MAKSKKASPTFELVRNSCNLIGPVSKMSHDEWKETRNIGIGGSDIGAIAGFNPYRTAFQVHLAKIGKAQPIEENDAMLIGTHMEDGVAKVFTAKTGLEVEVCDFILTNKDTPWLLANVDRLVSGELAGLECKIAGINQTKLWEDGGCPPSYELQCRWYMAATGLPKWYLACVIGGNRWELRVIERDMDIERDMLTLASRFWDRVQSGDMPEIDASPDCAKYLSGLYPKSNGNTIEMPIEVMPLVCEMSLVKANIKEMESREEWLTNQIKAFMGANEKALSSDGLYKITYKAVETTRLDTDRLKKERPDIYKDYGKTTTSRRFTFAG